MLETVLDDCKPGFYQLFVHHERVLAAHEYDLWNVVARTTYGLDHDTGFLGQELPDLVGGTIRETRRKLKIAGAGHSDAREFDDTLFIQLDRVGVDDSFDFVAFQALFDCL